MMDLVEEGVAVRRVVMEEEQLTGAGFPGHPDGFYPGAVTPTVVLGVFFGSVLGVVDEQVGPGGVVAQDIVERGMAVLQVRGIDDNCLPGLDAVATAPWG